MHWNECGEFVNNCQVIKQGNILNLVNNVVRHGKYFHPHGWLEFAEGTVLQDLIVTERDGIGCI